MTIKIDRGIAIPVARGGRVCASKYPFAAMQIGDSFFVVEPRNRISSAAHGAGKRLSRKFTVREWTQDGVVGWRVWRVATDPAPVVNLKAVS